MKRRQYEGYEEEPEAQPEPASEPEPADAPPEPQQPPETPEEIEQRSNPNPWTSQ